MKNMELVKSNILLMVFTIISNSIYCQTIKNDSFRNIPLFKNSEIEYCVGNFTNSFFIPIEHLGLKIDYINHLKDTNIFNTLKQIKKEDWIELLENEQSDWATTIILHYLLNESAVSFAYLYREKEFRDLRFWRFSFKNEEVSILTKLLDEKPFREKMCCEYSYTILYCSAENKYKKKSIKQKIKRKRK